MFIADIENPFRAFMSSCGAPQHTVDMIPAHPRNSILGNCSFLDEHWIHYKDVPKYSIRPILFFISLDGCSSDAIYSYWNNNCFKDNANLLVPEFITECSNPIVYFDNSAEGHCDEYIFKFISQIVDKFDLNPDTTFYGNSCYNIKEIHQASRFKNFKVIHTNNFKEDTVSALYDEIINTDIPAEKKFLYSCLNNTPKAQRALLLGGLIERGLDYEGFISSPTVPFGELFSNTTKVLSTNLANNKITVNDFNTGIRYLNNLQEKYPLILDNRSDDAIHMSQISDNNDFVNNYFSCELQVITESTLGKEIFITEKFYKPIMMKQPFIVLGANNYLNTLKQQGYHIFEHLYTDWLVVDKERNIINAINHTLQSLENILIKKDSPSMWEDLLEKNKISTEHNFNHFIQRKNTIDSKTRTTLDEWLEVYPEFLEVFNCYN